MPRLSNYTIHAILLWGMSALDPVMADELPYTCGYSQAAAGLEQLIDDIPINDKSQGGSSADTAAHTRRVIANLTGITSGQACKKFLGDPKEVFAGVGGDAADRRRTVEAIAAMHDFGKLNSSGQSAYMSFNNAGKKIVVPSEEGPQKLNATTARILAGTYGKPISYNDVYAPGLRVFPPYVKGETSPPVALCQEAIATDAGTQSGGHGWKYLVMTHEYRSMNAAETCLAIPKCRDRYKVPDGVDTERFLKGILHHNGADANGGWWRENWDLGCAGTFSKQPYGISSTWEGALLRLADSLDRPSFEGVGKLLGENPKLKNNPNEFRKALKAMCFDLPDQEKLHMQETLTRYSQNQKEEATRDPQMGAAMACLGEAHFTAQSRVSPFQKFCKLRSSGEISSIDDYNRAIQQFRQQSSQ